MDIDDSKKQYGSAWEEKLKPAVQVGNAGKIISKMSYFGSWIFWILIFVIVILIIAGSVYFYNYFSTSRGISLSLSVQKSVLAGVPFDIMINFSNGSKNILKETNLSLFLPEGAVILGVENDKRVFSKGIGDLNPGEDFQDNIKAVIFRDSQTVKNFNISISYSSALGVRFEKNEKLDVLIRESGIKIDLITPEKVLNNGEFDLEINYSNVSEFDFSNVKLDLDFPKGFFLKKSNPQIIGDILEIGNLSKGKSGGVIIVGAMSMPDQSFFEIKSKLESSYNGESVVVSEKSAIINITPSPLSLKIVSEPSGVVFPESFLKYNLVYANNTDIGLKDVIIKVKLIGEMFNFNSLKTNSSFDSRDNTIIWNAASSPELRLIDPGVSGIIEFEIQLKPNYPIKKINDKNFVLKIDAEISSPTVPYYVAAEKTIGLASSEIKIGGAVSIESSVYFRDPSSNIINQGSLPLKVNKPINFIIHWIIKNFATDIKNVVIKSYLPPGARFTGIVNSNINSMPIFNERTQEIIWQIDKIIATKGVINAPIEAVFQIEVVPNLTQIGSNISLVGEVLINALDEFTGFQIGNQFGSLTTQNLKDVGFDSNYGNVVP